MQIAGLAADLLGDVGGEGDDVVLDFFLDLEDARDVESALAPEGARGGLRNQPRFGFRFRRGDFDLEPLLELIFVRPDAAHFGARITRDHRT